MFLNSKHCVAKVLLPILPFPMQLLFPVQECEAFPSLLVGHHLDGIGGPSCLFSVKDAVRLRIEVGIVVHKVNKTSYDNFDL